jgi:hypothetical protein
MSAAIELTPPTFKVQQIIAPPKADHVREGVSILRH